MTPEERIVARLYAVFGEPRTTNPQMFLEEFSKAIKGYSAEVLERAGDEVIANSTFWPKPKELRDQATAIATLMARRNKPAPRPEPPPPPLTPEQQAEADSIMAKFYETMRQKTLDEEGSVNWQRGQKPQFEAMMKNSPNRGLYEKHAEITRRITGERE